MFDIQNEDTKLDVKPVRFRALSIKLESINSRIEKKKVTLQIRRFLEAFKYTNIISSWTGGSCGSTVQIRRRGVNTIIVASLELSCPLTRVHFALEPAENWSHRFKSKMKRCPTQPLLY